MRIIGKTGQHIQLNFDHPNTLFILLSNFGQKKAFLLCIKGRLRTNFKLTIISGLRRLL